MKIPVGSNGVAGKNRKGIQNPADVTLFKPSITINKYKAYLLDWLAVHGGNQSDTSNLLKFLKSIENEKEIQSLYDTSGLIDILSRIEEQYLRLHGKVDIRFHVQSLMTRVEKYAKTQKDQDQKDALNMLYTAAASKLINTRDRENYRTSGNLTGSLESINGTLYKLRKFDYSSQYVSNARYEEKEILMGAIETSLILGEEDISSKLQTSSIKLNSTISTLIEEIKKIIEPQKIDKEKLEVAQRKLKDSFLTYLIMNVLKAGDTAVTIFNSVGWAITEIMDVVLHAEREFWYKDSSSSLREKKKVQILRNGFAVLNVTVNIMNEVFSEDAKLLQMQLEDVGKLLIDDLGSEVKTTINDAKLELRTILQSDIIDPTLIKALSADILGMLTRHAAKNNLEKQRILWKMIKIMKIGKAGIEVYLQIRSNSTLLGAVLKPIEEVNHRYLEQIKTQIYWKVMPMVKYVEALKVSIRDSLAGESKIKLDFGEWEAQSKLKCLKDTFNEVFGGAKLQADLARSAVNINEAMKLLVNLYDRIDSYYDTSKFATFFINLNLNKPLNFKDPELNRSTSNLTNIIHANIIFREYELGRLLFNRHYFPFAQYHSRKFQLHTHINFNDPATLLDHISLSFEGLIGEKPSNGKYDSEIISDTNCLFYRWSDRDVIAKIIEGEEIVIKADIRKGLPVSAVKFKRLALKIVSEDGYYPFESIFWNYDVLMTMVGNSLYTCGKQIYNIPATNVHLHYSIARNPDGSVIRKNSVYKTFEENSPFLSPYASWKIQLKKSDILLPKHSDLPSNKEFKNFENKTLHLELHGDGEYFNGETYTTEVCTKELKKYYKYYDELIEIIPK